MRGLSLGLVHERGYVAKMDSALKAINPFVQMPPFNIAICCVCGRARDEDAVSCGRAFTWKEKLSDKEGKPAPLCSDCYYTDRDGLDMQRLAIALRESSKEIDALSVEEQVNHPKHYNDHPSGIECITIVRHFNFALGNVIKYVWRAGLKSQNPIQDLEKARFYLDDEINRLKGLVK